MPKLKLLAAATTAALFTVGGAFAQSSATFSLLDKDNDGQISRAEWNDHHAAGAASSGGSISERRDSGAQRGYPTSRTGEPRVGGSVTSDDPARGAATSGGTAAGAASGTATPNSGTVQRGPTSHIGEPEVGGSRTADDAARGTAATGGTAAGSTRDGMQRDDQALEGARRGYPTSPIGEPAQGGSRTADDVPRSQTR